LKAQLAEEFTQVNRHANGHDLDPGERIEEEIDMRTAAGPKDTAMTVQVYFAKRIGVGVREGAAYPGAISFVMFNPGISEVPRDIWAAHGKYLTGAGAHRLNPEE
jgi:hypothetical protein